MSVLQRLPRLIPDLSATLVRFPVPALVSVLITIYAHLDIAGSVSDGTRSGNHVYLGGAAAFIAAGAAHYFARGRGLGGVLEIVLALAAALLAAALAYFDVILRTSHLFLFAGLMPLLMIAGYLHRGAEQGALWLFNMRLWLSALLAIIVGLIFAGGLSAIIESLRFLFNVDVPHNAHEHVWATAAALIAPIYGLSLAPRDLTEEVEIAQSRDTLIERGVSVLVNYVMVPIAVIYALILHAYAVKVLVEGVLPRGQIGLMVTIFALGGTATWLIAWPWRDSGARLLRLYMRGWFWLTIVPAILLVFALWERVSAYGVTPDRYGIGVVAVWLVIVTAYLAIRRNRADMRLILGSLALLLLIGSTGPWGANSVSINSQYGRLVTWFDREMLLTPDRKIVEPIPKISDDGKREIHAIVNALNEMDGLDKLRPLFEGRKDDPFTSGATGWELVSKISELLKLQEYIAPVDQVSFSANWPIAQNYAGQGRIIGPIRALQKFDNAAQQDLSATIDGQTMTIRVGEKRWVVPVRGFLEKMKTGITPSPQVAILYEAGSDITLIVTEAYGEVGETPRLSGATLWVILKE
jgi:hypothetical protein